jgi:hypothetical protein
MIISPEMKFVDPAFAPGVKRLRKAAPLPERYFN